LKIPKGDSEALNRKTDNTMDERTKNGQIKITQKTKEYFL
jgi:hypothetical protein